MNTRTFVFMPSDNPDALLFAAAQKRMESTLGGLFARDLCNTWTSPLDATRELLSLLYSVDMAMSTVGREFPDDKNVSTMLRQWAIGAPKVLTYCTRLLSAPDEIDLLEIAEWFMFITIRRQTLELNGIDTPVVEESPACHF